MTAAAELIAERGWGRVTTRAVAERAALPHGAVSYHFHGKQELLIEATLFAFERALPIEEFGGPITMAGLLDLMAGELVDPRAVDSVVSRLMFEAMREAERDPTLRTRLGEMLGRYRSVMVETVRAAQQRAGARADPPAEALATLLAAVGDGLLLHVMLDPGTDVAGALDALRTLLERSGSSGARPASAGH
jgi:AcrR family transcriptional regulator